MILDYLWGQSKDFQLNFYDEICVKGVLVDSQFHYFYTQEEFKSQRLINKFLRKTHLGDFL